MNSDKLSNDLVGILTEVAVSGSTVSLAAPSFSLFFPWCLFAKVGIRCHRSMTCTFYLPLV